MQMHVLFYIIIVLFKAKKRIWPKLAVHALITTDAVYRPTLYNQYYYLKLVWCGYDLHIIEWNDD
jgi:hypothetical protein